MIFSFTPNPALDLSGVVDRLVPNEKCYVHNETRSPGGNAINAARVLHRLKVPVLATGFLGGSTGREIKDLLRSEGVRCKFIPIGGHSRICVTVSNRRDRNQTRLTFPGPHVTRGEIDQLLRLFGVSKSASLLLIGGSLPKGCTVTHIKLLMKMAQRRGVETIVDCPGDILREVIVQKPLLIKPNLTEFQQCTGSSARSIGEVLVKGKALLKSCPFVCVSSVEGGTLLLTRNGNYFGRTPRVVVRSTVGAGDSMVGAMAAEINKGRASGDNLLKWGLAAAAATLEQPGTAFGSAAQIRTLYKKVAVKSVG